MKKIFYILFIVSILLSYSCIAILFTDTTVLSSRQGGSQVACEGMNFNVSGNVTLKTAIKLSGATGQNIKLYNGSCGQPFGAPVLDYDTTVTGDNSTFPNYPLFVGNIYYICVDYNTNPYTQGFDDFVTPSIGNKVTWISSCTAIGGHTDNSYTRDIYGLVTELSCVANWTQSNTSCILNMQQILYTDINNCGNLTPPSNNGTFISCGCFENWVHNDTICNGYNNTINYYDSNNCNTSISLPSNNGTLQLCQLCTGICQNIETPYSNCCIITPIGNYNLFEIFDENMHIILNGSAYPLSNFSEQTFIPFNEPVGIYHVVINNGTRQLTTDIKVVAPVTNNIDLILYISIIIFVFIFLIYLKFMKERK